jgi:hypothetical protein
VLRGGSEELDGRVADLEEELYRQRRMRGMLDQPLVMLPPS